MKKLILYTLTSIWVVTVLLASYGFYQASNFLRTSPAMLEQAKQEKLDSEEKGQIVKLVKGENILVDIPTGSSLGQVSQILHDNNVITNPFYFNLLARYLEADTNLKAGRFEFNTSWLPQQVLDHLLLGKTAFSRLTVREGLTWWEIGRLLEAEGYTTFDDFKKVIHDREFLAHWGIPFSNAEGFLYPDTYYLPAPKELNEQAAKAIAGRLIDTFWRKTDPVWREVEKSKGGLVTPADKRIYPTREDLKTYLTLASIIEKETGVPHERARVSGVYANRLKTNMRLQADPTVSYGVGENFKPPLLRQHLDDPSNPYNTYRNEGLPPGPIASPSLASIRAAIKPEQHGYYYFVAKGTDGSHYFGRTLSEHNQNVQLYRQTIKAN